MTLKELEKRIDELEAGKLPVIGSWLDLMKWDGKSPATLTDEMTGLIELAKGATSL
jgi:hypothetical protein